MVLADGQKYILSRDDIIILKKVISLNIIIFFIILQMTEAAFSAKYHIALRVASLVSKVVV